MQANSVVLIPFNDDSDEPPPRGMPSSDPSLDPPSSPFLRLKKLEKSWQKCHAKIQEILERLYRATADDVGEVVLDASASAAGVLLPIPQIPTVVLEDQAGGSHLVLERLEDHLNSDDLEDAPPWPRGYVVRLTARTCPTTAAAVKALVRGFSSSFVPATEDDAAPRGGTGEDLSSLRREYDELFSANPSTAPKLVLIFDDFETFEPLVMQDLIDICSTYIPSLPLRFVITVSTGLNYLSTTIPRPSLALLRIQTYPLPSSQHICDEMLQALFFDPTFEPALMIGPQALEGIRERCAQYDMSIDGIVTHLHLLHIYHFYQPISVLADWDEDEEQRDTLLSPEFATHVRASYARSLPSLPPEDSEQENTGLLEKIYGVLCEGDVDSLSEIATHARQSFHRTMRSLRAALVVLRVICEYLTSVGLRLPEPTSSFVELCQLVMSGESRPVVRQVVRHVKQLEHPQLLELLLLLHKTFNDQPQIASFTWRELHQALVACMNTPVAEDTESSVALTAGEKFMEYFTERFVLLSTLPLHQAFCMGLGEDYLTTVLDPSVRSALFTAMTEPHRYLDPEEEDEGASDEPPDLSSFPDASILFLRSLDAGKKINTYDWYESFTFATENEEHEERGDERAGAVNGDSGKAPLDEGEASTEHQARFIRAMQELQFAGLLKSSNRPLDLVTRTVFDTID